MNKVEVTESIIRGEGDDDRVTIHRYYYDDRLVLRSSLTEPQEDPLCVNLNWPTNLANLAVLIQAHVLLKRLEQQFFTPQQPISLPAPDASRSVLIGPFLLSYLDDRATLSTTWQILRTTNSNQEGSLPYLPALHFFATHIGYLSLCYGNSLDPEQPSRGVVYLSSWEDTEGEVAWFYQTTALSTLPEAIVVDLADAIRGRIAQLPSLTRRG